jgi:NTP pyrophosphatase (non-canonical NTP hydrolase)
VPSGETDQLTALQVRLRRFVADRDWGQHHDAKNLAMAIVGEAGELAAELQWVRSEDVRRLGQAKRQRVAEEAADVFLYLLHLADGLDFDLLEVATAVAERNEHRFPPVEVR